MSQGGAGSVALLRAGGVLIKAGFPKRRGPPLLSDGSPAPGTGSVPHPTRCLCPPCARFPLQPPVLAPWPQPVQVPCPRLCWVQQAPGTALPAPAVGPCPWGSSCSTCRALGGRRRAVPRGWDKGCSAGGV